jgi:hypothetical protein
MIEKEGVRRFLLHGNELKTVMTVTPDPTGPEIDGILARPDG